jgi:hypothetical protein
VKDNVDPSNIPKELLKEMNKYFSITVHKEVVVAALKQNLSDGNITKREYEGCIHKSETFALRVTG